MGGEQQTGQSGEDRDTSYAANDTADDSAHIGVVPRLSLIHI